MIFTIGHGPSYDRGLQENPKLEKLGFRFEAGFVTYDGGSVWEHENEAKAYLAANQPRLAEYKVYGVVATWETDTAQRPGEPFRRLLVDSKIVAV